MKFWMDDPEDGGVAGPLLSCWAFSCPAEQITPAIHRIAKPRIVLGLITCHSPCELRFQLFSNTSYTYENIRRLVSTKWQQSKFFLLRVAFGRQRGVVWPGHFGYQP